MSEFEQPFMFKFRVGLRYGVVTDGKFFRKCADAGQLISLLKDARFYAMSDLLHQLQVKRLSCGWIELEDHGLLYHCYCTVNKTARQVDSILRKPA